MTKEELRQANHLREEISRCDTRILELRERASSTAQNGKGSRGKSSGPSDRVGSCAAAIADLQAKRDAYQAELDRIEAYIAAVPDRIIRQALEDRYLHGLHWRQVAARLGGGNTESGIRMACFRWLEKHP